MRKVLFFAGLLLLPALGRADDQAGDMWRWTDDKGTVHYTNVADSVPSNAETVKTRIIREVSRLPESESDRDLRTVDGVVVDAAEAAPAPRREGKREHRIYDAERLRRGCYVAGLLYFGGFSHSDDISGTLNCLPYMFGPEAWLNAAKAELALRQNGISQRDVFSYPAMQ